LQPDFTITEENRKFVRPIAAIIEHSLSPLIEKDTAEHRQAVESAYSSARTLLSAYKSKPVSAKKAPVVGRIHGVARYDV
jgi:hypothetical protein